NYSCRVASGSKNYSCRVSCRSKNYSCRVGARTIFTFSRRFYPKRLTSLYTHFTFTLMAHCTSGAIRGSVSCSRMLRQGIELATFRLLNDLSTSCTTIAHTHTHTHTHTPHTRTPPHHTHTHTNTHTHTHHT